MRIKLTNISEILFIPFSDWHSENHCMWSVKYFHDSIVFEFGNITVPVWHDWNSLPLLLHCEGMIVTIFSILCCYYRLKKDNGHGCSGIVSIATSLVKGSFSNIIDWNMVAAPLPLPCLQKDCPCTRALSLRKDHLTDARKNVFQCQLCDFKEPCTEKDFFSSHLRTNIWMCQKVQCPYIDCDFKTSVYTTFNAHKSKNHDDSMPVEIQARVFNT